MFEDYIQDSYSFFELGDECAKTDERSARMYFRASVFCAASALEAFLNFIGDTFEKGNSIDPNETAYLNDRVLEVSSSRGTVEPRTRYFSIDSKLKFVVNRFKVPIDLGTSTEWQHFIEFKDFRDSLVHPRDRNDEIELDEYRNRIRRGLNAYIDIMDQISYTLFGKHLRKGLTDLKI